MVAELVEELAAMRPARRGRPPASETVPVRDSHTWLPEGQLLASESDVMKALQIGESKLDDLVNARLLEPVRIDTARRFHPRDVDHLAERLYRERTISTGGAR